MISFKFSIKECFKLSSGATALVGLMEPSSYQIINTNDHVIKIKSNSGKSHIFNNISEDVFARSDTTVKNIFRSLQTYEDIAVFVDNMDNDPIFIEGVKKHNLKIIDQ